MELEAKAQSECVGLEDLLVDDELLEMVLAFVGGARLPGQHVNLPWRYLLPTLALVSSRWRRLMAKPEVRRSLIAGLVFAFGDYQSPTGLTEDRKGLPTIIRSLERVPVVDVCAGWQPPGSHALFLSATGQVPSSPSRTVVYAFGSGRYGKLGLGNLLDHDRPVLVDTLSGVNVRQVAAGQFHSLAVSERGEVFAFGCDDTGQLGLGRGHGYNPYQLYETSLQARLANVTVPERIAALAGRHIVAVAAGTHHSLFLSREGHVFSCGMDKYGKGRLGYKVDQQDNIQKLPLMIECLSQHRVVDISAGEAHSLVVTDAGVLFGFGSNVNGQLGLGMADTQSHLPTPVSVAGEPASLGLEGVVSVKSSVGQVVQAVAGQQHSLAVTSCGRVYSFGLGSLGLGDTEDRATPTLVAALGLVPVTRVSTSGRFSFAVA
ncbi:regulator of chromosome condensation (RCC1) repeat domain containing protein [Acanthamoeba castellanii str. Neff]|uniref:Regulator of chromosome condensation (RCC1) repeat domain containing protein n=1 Tax=Acanthamoeba castellanii (strain ATCC 30010 / Neff) TaxID=1257118 RepID=L8HI50_ACACF|nr:regulator of chromosome condensation (RCC1) repeat domain containing protein [Acanthamoeba castellanii str. Neff]ELR24066.1 regulator of chromosome condensation (RCC1) repeat domain containing protein [Acanthamoeba castellanii str. Neff]